MSRARNSGSRLRAWTWLHKWSSLACTLFMLLLCITGLPLIFHHEIGHLLGSEVEVPAISHSGPRASLDSVLRVAHARHPERVVQFALLDEDDDRLWFVTLTPTPAPTDDFRSVAVDARTGQLLAELRFDQGFTYRMFKLHVDLFAGLAGKLFLGFMGLLLLVAVVSGLVLYAPFMVWVFVVGATGVINTCNRCCWMRALLRSLPRRRCPGSCTRRWRRSRCISATTAACR